MRKKLENPSTGLIVGELYVSDVNLIGEWRPISRNGYDSNYPCSWSKQVTENLHSHKATGPDSDSIPTQLLKATADEVAGALRLIFQASLTRGTVPSDWKKAHIVPVFN